nr:hypothetical protein [Tanacetum cinerariifolium]
MFMHTAWDDNLLGTKRFVSRHEDTQVYGAILPEAMTNQAMLDSIAYKTYYAIASGAKLPKSNKNEGTGTKPGVSDVPKYDSESDKESWSDSEEEDDEEDTNDGDYANDGNDDDDNNDDGDNGDNDDNDDNNDDDDKNDDDDETDNDRTELDRIKITDLNQSSTKEHEEEEEEDVNDEEKMDEEEDDEVTKEFYKDVNVNLRNEDADVTYDDQGGADLHNIYQESGFEKVEEDAWDNRTIYFSVFMSGDESHDEHNVSKESGFVQGEEDAHVTITTVHDTQKIKERINEFNVEEEEKIDEEEDDDVTKELYKDVNVNLGNKDVDMTHDDLGGADEHNVSKESGFVQGEEDAHVTITTVHDTQKIKGPMQSSSVLSDFTSKLLNLANVSPADNENASLMTPTFFMKKQAVIHLISTPEEAQDEKQEDIDLIDTSVRAIIREEVNTQLPQILPKAVSDLATPAAASLSLYELTKILMDMITENKSHLRADYKEELYDAPVKSYNTNKDLFDRGIKRRKSRKEVESSKDPRSKKGKSSSSSKGTSRSHHKSFGKFAYLEEPSHTVDVSEVRQNKEFFMGNNDEQLDDEVALKEKPPTSFDELMDTLIEFSAFVLNRLKIPNVTQEILVGVTFNLLKGTCKSLTELEYHFEECSKAKTERFDCITLKES